MEFRIVDFAVLLVLCLITRNFTGKISNFCCSLIKFSFVCVCLTIENDRCWIVLAVKFYGLEECRNCARECCIELIGWVCVDHI